MSALHHRTYGRTRPDGAPFGLHGSTKPSRLPTTTSLWQPEPMPASDSLLKLKPGTCVALAALVLWLGTARAPAATEIDAVRVKGIVGFLPAKPAGFGRPITDRADRKSTRLNSSHT